MKLDSILSGFTKPLAKLRKFDAEVYKKTGKNEKKINELTNKNAKLFLEQKRAQGVIDRFEQLLGGDDICPTTKS